MRIAVMGSGGVGGYFGGRLAMADHDVWFIARGEHLRAIRQRGLQVQSLNGDFTVQPAQATDDPRTVGVVDIVIVAVKTWQLSEAARQMIPLVGPTTIVLPLLNGVGAAGELVRALPPSEILGGLCRIIAYVDTPGRILHTAIEPCVIFGALDNNVTDRVESVKRAFDEAGVQAEIAPDIRAALWRKFMLISTWSGIGAVTRAPLGVWRSIQGTRALAEASMQETLALAGRLSVALARDSVAETMTFHRRASSRRNRLNATGHRRGETLRTGVTQRSCGEVGIRGRGCNPIHGFFYHCLLESIPKLVETGATPSSGDGM